MKVIKASILLSALAVLPMESSSADFRNSPINPVGAPDSSVHLLNTWQTQTSYDGSVVDFRFTNPDLSTIVVKVHNHAGILMFEQQFADQASRRVRYISKDLFPGRYIFTVEVDGVVQDQLTFRVN
jgi:hypothetical protein